MDIHINVEHQKLTTEDTCYIAPGSQNFIRLIFNFTDDWNGLKIFAQFKQNGNAYNKYLDDNGSVYVPTEITNGECKIMLYGSHGSIIATSRSLKLIVSDDLLVSDAQSTVISTSLYNQLVTKLNTLTDRVTVLENIHKNS